MRLLPRVEQYLRSSGTAPTRFGRDAVRDPRFVFDLRNGRQPGGAMLRRVSDFLDRNEGGAPR